MRAWQVQQHGEPLDALALVEIDEPVPGPGEVRLRVLAAAVGMPDLFMCRATYPLTPSLPFVPGQEVCGVIDEIGMGVDLAPGTRVMGVTNFHDGRGGFAEAAIARADTIFRVPDEMADADAASFRIGYSTAWNGLVRRGQLQAGETLLVLGAAGGSGATAIQLGRALGARVIAVVAGAAKAEFCSAMGAHVVIDRSSGSVVDSVRAATDGRGVDVVYDPVGGESAEAVLDVIAPGGRMLAIGFASGRWVTVDTHHAVRRNYSLVGVYAGPAKRVEAEADHEALLALAAKGLLTPITKVVDFDQLPLALEAIESGTVIGKIVLRSPENL
jgi:NADPH2:quinone reductase